jgi:carbon starvation protein
LAGHEAWTQRYHGDWEKFGLGATIGAFVEGSANFLRALGMPLELAVGIIATLVACFAATTLDTATRLQRYVIEELAVTFNFRAFANKYAATGLAVGLGLAVAMLPGPTGAGSGGLILWPLFGAINQLLAGLAFMVTVFYLWRRSKPVLFAVLPMLMMLLVPGWALLYQMFAPDSGWLFKLRDLLMAETPLEWFKIIQNALLLGFGLVITGLQVWMTIEGLLLLPKVKGVLEKGLPPLVKPTPVPQPAMVEGRPA